MIDNKSIESGRRRCGTNFSVFRRFGERKKNRFKDEISKEALWREREKREPIKGGESE